MKSRVMTDKDFLRFKETIHRWMKHLALSEWEYEICHQQIGDDKLSSACIDFKGRTVLFELTRCVEGDWGTKTSVECLALHEVLHVLLADFAREIQRTHSDTEESVVAHEHAIIHRLSRRLLWN